MNKEPIIIKTHITFVHEKEHDGPKTRCWGVYTNYEPRTLLGRVAWFGRWTKYAFYPWPETVFEQVCLRDIAQFCEDRTREQRQTAARKSAATRAMKTTADIVKAVTEAQKHSHQKPLLIR
jgi:hypothetical protein